MGALVGALVGDFVGALVFYVLLVVFGMFSQSHSHGLVELLYGLVKLTFLTV